MEQERGISVSTAVMSFDYEGLRKLINISGHEDFSEDTYRVDCRRQRTDGFG